MTPGEVGRMLRQQGYLPEFIDDEPRVYQTFESDDGRTYVEINDGER